jgi:dipeptidyl aminopeptidase/acylaminoacyl peptidase
VNRARVASIVVIVLTAGLTAGTLAPAVDAAFPGTPGLLVFSSEGNIYTIAADGSPPLSQLTFDGASEHPHWSPAGDMIAFDRAGDIYVMSATGRDVRRLTTFGDSSQPAWAPSGKRLVFVHRPNTQAAGDLWTVSLTGGRPSRLTFQSDISCEIAQPTWSPLGGRIAYAWQRKISDTECSTRKVVIMKIDPRQRHVIPLAGDPDFTADGRGVFFASRWDPEGGFFWPNEDLWWSDLSGGGREQLTSFYCAEGDPCFISGVGSPRSAFPGAASYAYLFSRLGGTICLSTSGGEGFCSDAIPVRPHEIDWQAVPIG